MFIYDFCDIDYLFSRHFKHDSFIFTSFLHMKNVFSHVTFFQMILRHESFTCDCFETWIISFHVIVLHDSYVLTYFHTWLFHVIHLFSYVTVSHDSCFPMWFCHMIHLFSHVILSHNLFVFAPDIFIWFICFRMWVFHMIHMF